MTKVARSWLYVPGNRPERIAKALAAGADAVVIDLEDAVPPDHKQLARQCAVRAAETRRGGSGAPRLWVRVNDPMGPWGEADLDALHGVPLDGLRVPRTESAVVVRGVAQRSGLPLQLLLETAAGLLNAQVLAAAHPLVVGIGLGEADLAADLRVVSDEGLAWARGWIVAVARAAGMPSPIQSVWTNVADTEGLRTSTEQGRQTGFLGRSVIHPRQIPVVHSVFTPSSAEVEAALAIVKAFEEARRHGEVAVLDDKGRFIDPAVVDRARLVLEIGHGPSIQGFSPITAYATTSPHQETS
jgi:citrate lyase subunit beta/citryl-CoA lyase